MNGSHPAPVFLRVLRLRRGLEGVRNPRTYLKHAVRLSTVAELTSPEIAEVLGINEGTVRTRLMRARRILRVALAAALGLVLAAAGILLRKREREPGVPSKGEEIAASAAPAPVEPQGPAPLPPLPSESSSLME